MRKLFLFVLIVFSLWPSVMFGGVCTGVTSCAAADCNESTISAALSSIDTDGTTLTVPSGNCTWTTSLSYTQTKSFVLQGAGAISGTGLQASINGIGSDSTTITDNINRYSSDLPTLAISTAAGKTFRMTGIAFYGPTVLSVASQISCNGTPPNPCNETYLGYIRIQGSSTSVRVDHCHFKATFAKGLMAGGSIEGVFDHNQHDGDSTNVDEFQMNLENGPGPYGNTAWSTADNFGTSHFIYIENSNFQMVTGSAHIFAFDCDFGGRFAFRYNAVGTRTALQTHGTGSGGDFRGCRAFEQYHNTYVYSATPSTDHFPFLNDYESGPSMIWDENVTGFSNFIQGDVPRTNTATYTQHAPPAGWGYCGTTYGPSNWDGNNDSTGNPCIDSIGRGQSDSISGTFPTKQVDTNPGVYTGTWPNQALSPTYMFMNTYTPATGTGYWSNYAPVAIQENRDYYLDCPNSSESSCTFDGSINGSTHGGTGYGLTAARPATCTPRVGYWATDYGTQGGLYVCTATNTWTLYYAPYTYPHPLVGGQADTPTFNPGSESHTGTLTITISATSGTVLCHDTSSGTQTNGDGSTCAHGTAITTNSGTNCVASSTVCGDVTVSTTQTQYAVSGSASLTDSSEQHAAYIITSQPIVAPGGFPGRRSKEQR